MGAEIRKFNFLAGLTVTVVVLYIGAALIALWFGKTDFAAFSAAVGPIAGTLVGYWLRGESAA